MKTKYVEIIKPKIKVLLNIKIWYSAIFNNFILTQFKILIHALKTSYKTYKKKYVTKYYKMLDMSISYHKFLKLFFKKL